MKKRLYKSRNNKKLCGVCAGIAEYFNIDPTIVRLVWVLLAFAYGGGLFTYLIAALVMSEEPIDLDNIVSDPWGEAKKNSYKGPDID